MENIQKTSINSLIENNLNCLYDCMNIYKSRVVKINDYKEIKYNYEEISEKEYKFLLEHHNKIDFNDLERKFTELENILKNYEISYNNFKDDYNSNYQSYLKMKLNNILERLLTAKESLKISENFVDDLKEYNDFYSRIMNIDTSKDIMEYFAFSKKNYVIFGKNGSGKTKLLNYIKNNYFKVNSYVIPANRCIDFGKQRNINILYNEKRTLTNIFDVESYEGYTNDLLTAMLKNQDYDELRKGSVIYNENLGINLGKTLNDVIEIFNNLSIERKLTFDADTYEFKLYNDSPRIPSYSIKFGSDGEKSIIQYILFILLCPKNAFVFIDEPETHLNTALLNELFHILEIKRNDLIFIYCTHNVDFIETRTNCKLIYLNKYDGNNWDIKENNSFDNIPIEIIINIIGTKKKILFIESNDQKIDYKFYTTLFREYKVIPVSSCTKVIENCKVINQNKLFKREAYGIIDNDYRTEQEIEKLKKYHVFTLKYNEIENLLLSSKILNYICNEVLHSSRDILKLQELVIEKARKERQGIIQDYINKIYSKMQKQIHIKNDSIIEIQKQIESNNLDNQKNFFVCLKDFTTKLDEYISNKDYEKLIQVVADKGFLSCITVLGITKDRYLELLLSYLNCDDDFKNIIINIYFDFLR